MKSILVIGVVILLFVLTLFSACQNDERTTVRSGDLPSSVETEAPDDIVFTPGGDAYRANVHQEGVPDKWPSIQTVYINLDSLNIRYRANIETRAGEIRNNIITVIQEGGFIDNKLELYSLNVPNGMELTDTRGAGLPRTLVTVLQIDISPVVSAGQYTFQIGIQIDGEDYGTIPCTIQVIE